MSNIKEENRRVAVQPLLPVQLNGSLTGAYDIYPRHTLGKGKVHADYEGLVEWMLLQKEVCIDGYTGILWDELYETLQLAFNRRGVSVVWHFAKDAMKEEEEINAMIAPFLGEEGSVWGTRTHLRLKDFFKLKEHTVTSALHIIIGTGAALLNEKAPVIYLDLPKNELQYRMRAGVNANLGSSSSEAFADMYKQAYFVDWVILNAHKQSLLPRIRIFADTQRGESITWAMAEDLLEGIDNVCRDTFRVRPWFEPGAWGGQWMKEKIPGLSQEAVNFAWSFEMIVPENGVVFESDGYLLEMPFEWLMFLQHKAILGKHASIFRYDFPIRFDFLDTFDGGNLSIQCHPSLSYIREHFGETITQDETYYILDCKDDAKVYLGFHENIDPAAFRADLDNSVKFSQPVNIRQYVQAFKASKHALFLIPNGTVHSAGANNLVLEISATPYIFTFKMYDWLRLGLDGEPRAINIEHAFRNLQFSRQGAAVEKELISVPALLEEGKDWQLIHLPTHREHFYDVQRIELDTTVSFETAQTCLVMMLVEGTSISIKTATGAEKVYHYAETFVIPADAATYTITNLGKGRAKVIKAFLKEEHPVFSNIMYE
ncbi:hypothetical protein GFS24_02155 [Chitinophaga sp. SYP-B3965]|uniref:class I mannose-6-phosphate isomerase n=1 Tax=Chitinophaga sp. SYP-B3965 TaxID=2663120 RepID=UPI0012998FD1|nr:class I mannose-6-phosphate isomerase [Chitinophaga sp. SYP-B3965]MRG43895.1 hypothetical protein [Chitinophaga sp. SYP-B3965]